MQRLGYTRYVAQGGDWGNAVSETMALQQPPGLLGIHTNMPATVPADVSKALSARRPAATPVSRLMKSMPGTNSMISTSTASATPRRCRTGPRRFMASRIRLSASPPGCWITTSAATSMICTRLRRTSGGPDAGRYPRQRHALLADQHGDLLGASLLGKRKSRGGFFDPNTSRSLLP